MFARAVQRASRNLRASYRFKKTITQNITANKRLLDATAEARNQAAQNNFESITIINLTQFIALLNLDISYLARSMLTVRDVDQAKLAARYLMLNIAEGSDDLGVMLGKPLRQSLSRLGLESLLPSLSIHQKSFTRFRAANLKLLREVRNHVTAHRDHDASRQIRLRKRIDIEEVSLMTTEMLDLCTHLSLYLCNVTDEITNICLSCRSRQHLDDECCRLRPNSS